MESRLKELRLKHNYTKRDVAKKIGISDRGYSNYEEGKRVTPVDLALKLAELYDTTVEHIFKI